MTTTKKTDNENNKDNNNNMVSKSLGYEAETSCSQMLAA